MIVTICEYESRARAPFTYKLCIKTEKNNLVYQSNSLNDIHELIEMLYIDLSDKTATIKMHRNYNDELTCTQKIYLIRSEI